MVPVTNVLVLPYQFIENTFEWYRLEISISISIVLIFAIYQLYRGWQKYEIPTQKLHIQSTDGENIEELINTIKVTKDREEFCQITRRIFELKYGFTLITGRSILSQKIPQDARNILMQVEGYEYATIRSGDEALEKIRGTVLTHLG